MSKKERINTGITNKSKLPLLNNNINKRLSKTSISSRSTPIISPLKSTKNRNNVNKQKEYIQNCINERDRETTIERLNNSLITLSMTKYKNFQDNFRALDKNHDGKLQYNEFLDMVKSNGLDTEQHAKDLFDQFKDEDGSMSYLNFLKLLQTDTVGGLNRIEYIPKEVKQPVLRDDPEENKKAYEEVNKLKANLLWTLSQRMKVINGKKNVY